MLEGGMLLLPPPPHQRALYVLRLASAVQQQEMRQSEPGPVRLAPLSPTRSLSLPRLLPPLGNQFLKISRQVTRGQPAKRGMCYY